MTDERRRRAARALADGTVDALEAQRIATERARERDPLAKLEAIIEAARTLYQDRRFTLLEVLRTLRHARNGALRAAQGHHPKPGYLWVKDRWPDRRSLTLMRFAEPKHAPDWNVYAGSLCPPMCRTCGANGLVNGRCVLPADEAEGLLESEANAASWWRGPRSDGGRAMARAARDFVVPWQAREEGLRHNALVYWDGTLGVVAVEVKTGTAREVISSVFPVLKKKRSEAYAPIDRARLRAWALAEDPRRVLMTTRYAEGPDRGPDAEPLWTTKKERRT